jgi:hypothetical protein
VRIIVDASDALRVAADLERAAAQIVTRSRPAVTQAATAARDAMRADMSQSDSFGHAAGSITFDNTGSGSFVGADIGPTKPAGAIANIAYFGGSHGGGGTVRDPLAAAESANPAELLSAIVEDLL